MKRAHQDFLIITSSLSAKAGVRDKISDWPKFGGPRIRKWQLKLTASGEFCALLCALICGQGRRNTKMLSCQENCALICAMFCGQGHRIRKLWSSAKISAPFSAAPKRKTTRAQNDFLKLHICPRIPASLHISPSSGRNPETLIKSVKNTVLPGIWA